MAATHTHGQRGRVPRAEHKRPDDLPAFNRAIIDALVEELADEAA